MSATGTLDEQKGGRSKLVYLLFLEWELLHDVFADKFARCCWDMNGCAAIIRLQAFTKFCLTHCSQANTAPTRAINPGAAVVRQKASVRSATSPTGCAPLLEWQLYNSKQGETFIMNSKDKSPINVVFASGKVTPVVQAIQARGSVIPKIKTIIKINGKFMTLGIPVK